MGSTQPLIEMSTMNLPGGKGRLVREADNLAAICEPIVLKMWEPRRLTTLWASTACYRDSLTITYMRFEVLKAVTVKIVTPCSLIDRCQRFGETC
jgi:hypothetical protein